MNRLVTGANGFVGRALVARFAAQGLGRTVGTTRRAAPLPAGVTPATASLEPDFDWSGLLDGIDVVVHVAARAHVRDPEGVDSLELFRGPNVDGTMNLARAAARAGVGRFVFVSTIGVHGASTRPGEAFRESSPLAPHSPYAQSKLEAEQQLARLADETGLELVVVRPPLVYGPGAPGNFGLLVRLVRRRLPLPLGRVRNRRSLVSLGNLVDLLDRCSRSEAAAGRTFVASDGHDVSTPELIRSIGRAAGVSPVLLPAPVRVLRRAAALAGQAKRFEQLGGDLVVDSSEARRVLDWTPPEGFDAAIRQAVAG